MIPLVDPDLTKALAEIRGRAELLLVHLEPRSPLRDEAAAIMDAAAEAAALAPGGAPAERPPTVLLAEDEDTVRRMLVTVLESAGFQVLAAANGYDALAAAAAEPGPIDVLVTDVVMPAMDGVELAERLAADRPDTRVVFVSGYTQHPALEEGLRLGTLELLRKPFSIHDLIARVQALAAELRPLTCVVADDHPPILDAVARFLEAEGLQVVATAANGPDALRALEEHQPDVALVDVRMPGFDGVELTRRAAAAGSETRVALYTGSADPDLLSEALAAGAAGFVLKHTPLAEVVSAVRAVAAGGVYVDRELAAEVARAADSEPRAALTSREREVLALVAKGLTNDRIAEQLQISAETVQTHVRNVMAKLHASTRTEAVASALRAALIG